MKTVGDRAREILDKLNKPIDNMDKDIKHKEDKQIAEELNQWFNDVEREVPMPQEYIQYHGKWQSFKDYIEEILWQYTQIQEEVNGYREDKMWAENTLQRSKRRVQDAVDALLDTETITEQELKALIVQVAKDLKKLI